MSRKNATWSDSEIAELKELWGDRTPDFIARKLGRTVGGVIQKANKLKLGSYLSKSEFITLHQATELMGVDSHVPQRTWIPKYNLPVTRRRIRGNLIFSVLRFDDFMEWLQAHPEAWDSRKVPLYGLGTEPPWLTKKREEDRQRSAKPVGTKYTAADDAVIIQGRRRGKSYKEIGQQIRRSADSVQARADRMRF